MAELRLGADYHSPDNQSPTELRSVHEKVFAFFETLLYQSRDPVIDKWNRISYVSSYMRDVQVVGRATICTGLASQGNFRIAVFSQTLSYTQVLQQR